MCRADGCGIRAKPDKSGFCRTHYRLAKLNGGADDMPAKTAETGVNSREVGVGMQTTPYAIGNAPYGVKPQRVGMGLSPV